MQLANSSIPKGGGTRDCDIDRERERDRSMRLRPIHMGARKDIITEGLIRPSQGISSSIRYVTSNQETTAYHSFHLCIGPDPEIYGYSLKVLNLILNFPVREHGRSI